MGDECRCPGLERMRDHMTVDVSNRAAIPAQYKWNLQDIFSSDAQWEQALAELQEKLDQVTACAGRLQEPGVLEDCLKRYEALSQLLEKTYMYAKMLQDLDNASSAAQTMHDRVLNLLFKIQEGTAFLVPEMTAMAPDALRRRIQDNPEMGDFRHMVDVLIRSREHVLSTREEQLMAMAAPAMESMDAAFSMLDSVDLKRGEMQDEEGHTVTLTDGLFGRFRESRDRRVRADAFATLHGAFKSMGNTIASL